MTKRTSKRSAKTNVKEALPVSEPVAAVAEEPAGAVGVALGARIDEPASGTRIDAVLDGMVEVCEGFGEVLHDVTSPAQAEAVAVDCPKCGGTGIYEPAEMGGVIRIDCNECNATGRVLMTEYTGTELTEPEPDPVISE